MFDIFQYIEQYIHTVWREMENDWGEERFSARRRSH
jgi:hypothetical protein